VGTTWGTARSYSHRRTCQSSRPSGNRKRRATGRYGPAIGRRTAPMRRTLRVGRRRTGSAGDAGAFKFFHRSSLPPAGRREAGGTRRARGTDGSRHRSPRTRAPGRTTESRGKAEVRPWAGKSLSDDARSPCAATPPGRSGRASARGGRPRRSLPPSRGRQALGGWASRVRGDVERDRRSGSCRDRDRPGVEDGRAVVRRGSRSDRRIREKPGRGDGARSMVAWLRGPRPESSLVGTNER